MSARSRTAAAPAANLLVVLLFISLKPVAGVTPADRPDWPVYGGDARRSAQGVGGPAILESRWKQPTYRTLETKAFLDQAENFLLRQRNYPLLPAFSPVTATVTRGERKLPLLLYRSHWGLHAVNMASGKLEWETPSAWSVDRMMKDHRKAAAINQWLAFYVQQNQRPGIPFENSTTGTLATDNTYVFVVEDLAVPPPGGAASGNGMASDLTDAAAQNRLQAYALNSGKLRWERGGRFDEGDLQKAVFLAPPLPLKGRLYVLVEKDRENPSIFLAGTALRAAPSLRFRDLSLLCLEPDRGKVLWSRALLTRLPSENEDPLRRIQAAHLAYDGGILVCPTNAGSVLGYDLDADRLAWRYTYREPGPAPGLPRGAPRPVRPGPPQGQPAAPIDYTTLWQVTAPMIRDGKVVFTAPDGPALTCLGLRDGTIRWKQDRQADDLYLAGVYADRAVVVGKRSCRALSLDQGAGLWTVETGQPSGRGVAAAGIYYLPLREGLRPGEPELCAIDLVKGRVVSHTHAPGKQVAGNLVFAHGDLISQTVTDVVAYPLVASRLTFVNDSLDKHPDNPVGLTERGALRLDVGDVKGAVEDLTKALKGDLPADSRLKARARLYQALTELFERDFDKAEPYLKDFEDLCKVDDNAPGAERAEAGQRRAAYLMALARGREKQGRVADALPAYLALASAGTGDDMLVSPQDRALKVRRDVWIHDHLAGLLARASGEERRRMEEEFSRKWKDLQADLTLPALRTFASIFGTGSVAGLEAHRVLAERLLGQKAYLEAELSLQPLLHGNDPATRARALADLARLQVGQGLLEDAVHYYRLLARDSPDTPLPGGNTGAGLLRDLGQDPRFLPYLAEPVSPARPRKFKVVEERGSFPFLGSAYRFRQRGEPLPFFARHNLTLRYDVNLLKLIDQATGQERWSQPLRPTSFPSLAAAVGQANQVALSYLNLGHLVILPVGPFVFGLDPVGKRLLWEKNLAGSSAPPGINPAAADPRDGSLLVTYPDGWSQQVGANVHLAATAVCVLDRAGLEALDPLTGRTLWSRSDVGPRARLSGDDRHLLVVETGSDNKASRARLIRVQDGSAVSVPDFAPLYDQRWHLHGSKILLSEPGPAGAVTLRWYDVLTGKDLWRQSFAAGSVPLLSEDASLAGMVEPEGKVRVYNPATGKPVLNTKLDNPGHAEKVLSAHLLRDGKDYYLMFNGPPDPDVTPQGNSLSNVVGGAALRCIPVNGYVYCFDAATGERCWYNEVTNQMLVVDHFRDMPVLLFTARYQQANGMGPGRIVNLVVSARTIDKRTGKILYLNDTVPSGMYFHELKADPATGVVEFTGSQMRIHFVPDAAPAKP